jgi:uncharacterized membrane protein
MTTPETASRRPPSDLLSGLIARIVAKGTKTGIERAFATQPGKPPSVFQEGITQGVQTAVTDTLQDEEARQRIEDKGVELVAGQIIDTKQEVLDHSKELIQQTANKISGTRQLETYGIIRKTLDKPNQSPFRSVFNKFIARILSFGVFAGSILSAKFLDRITGRNESEINSKNIEQIFNGAIDRITQKPITLQPAATGTPA